MKPALRALEPAGRAPEPAGRALEPAGRASEAAGRILEPGTPGREQKRKRITERNPLCGRAIGHCPLRDRCPKTIQYVAS